MKRLSGATLALLLLTTPRPKLIVTELRLRIKWTDLTKRKTIAPGDRDNNTMWTTNTVRVVD